MRLPFDPQGLAPLFLTAPDGYIHKAKYNLESVCDRETLIRYYSVLFYPEQCICKKYPFFPLAVLYRHFAQQFYDPTVDIAYKYSFLLPYIIEQYFLAAIPFAMLNVYLTYRVARECPGVRFHLLQAIGDIFDLAWKSSYCAFPLMAPLFAWTNRCIRIALGLYEALYRVIPLFSTFSLTLLCYDRYVAVCKTMTYSIWSKKSKKYIIIALAIAILPGILEFANQYIYALNVNENRLFLVEDIMRTILYTVCIIVILYCSVKTGKKAKAYQAPTGSQSAAESVEKMKRFLRLTVRVLILNSIYTLFLLYGCIVNVALDLCLFWYPGIYTYSGNGFQGFCKVVNQTFGASQITEWGLVLCLCTSNMGLLFHCMFSKLYRKEAKRLFHKFIGFFGYKETVAVTPLNSTT